MNGRTVSSIRGRLVGNKEGREKEREGGEIHTFLHIVVIIIRRIE